jgi:hypothetical protein
MAQEPTNGQILEAITNVRRDTLEALIDLRDRMAENFTMVYKKLEEHDRRFDNMDGRMGRLETRIEDLQRRLPA